jgi:hypothetical protein
MVVVTGHTTVQRKLGEPSAAGCMGVIEMARSARGRRGFALTSGCSSERRAATLSVAVGACDIDDVRPVFGTGRA